ncbi:MAG: twin-arginine translocase subunit TatC [Cellulosilyticaceae bacterium]
MMKILSNKKSAMGITEHLGELRSRLTKIGVTLLVLFFVCFQFSHLIVNTLVDIATKYGYKLVYLAPSELFVQYIKVAFIAAVVVASPIIIYQIWAFVKPGLSKRENRAILGGLFWGLICFGIGVFFSYKIVFPFMLHFFININMSAKIAATISITNYISFVVSSLLSFGIIFEMPVVIALLTQLGVLRAAWLVKGRKFMIVGIFVVCAIITPPDVVSQLMVAIPMIILFEMSVRISKILDKRRQKRMST